VLGPERFEHELGSLEPRGDFEVRRDKLGHAPIVDAVVAHLRRHMLTWASVRGSTLPGTTWPVADSRTPFRAQRTFWTFAILRWLLAMLCNLGVAIYERESAGAMVFTFTLLSVAIAFWLGS
jgi:hypothetical protein